MRDTLQDLLESEGFDVIPAANGKQAIDFLTLNDPPGADLVILDLMMPMVSGWEVLEVLTADKTLRRIPVIVLSRCRLAPGARPRACAQAVRLRDAGRQHPQRAAARQRLIAVALRAAGRLRSRRTRSRERLAGAPRRPCHVVIRGAAHGSRTSASASRGGARRAHVDRRRPAGAARASFSHARVRACRHAPAPAHGISRGRVR